MTRYFVRKLVMNKYTGILNAVLEGREDMGFDYGQLLSIAAPYMIGKYGFRTAPAAKRSWAYRNREDQILVTIEDVKIVKFDVDEDGRITMEVVKDDDHR